MKLNLREADIASVFNEGVQAHNAGDLSKAEKLYQETLFIQPDHCEANHNIGVVFVAKNELDKALEFFKFALDASPNVSLFWASYIDALIKLKRITESKTLVKALKGAGISCKNIEAISHRLDAEYQEPGSKESSELDELLAQQKFDDAIEACLSLMETYPSSAILNITLGKCYLELDQIEPAISSYQRAIEINPECAEAYFNLGMILKDKGELDAAIANYQKVIKIDPNSAEAYHNIGIAVEANGDLAGAIKYLEKAVSIKPDCAKTYLNMGTILKEKGDLQAAIESYQKGIQIDPNAFEVYNSMGNAFLAVGDLIQALNSFRKAIKIKPDYAEAYNNIGVTLSVKSDHKGAINAYHQSLLINPSFVGAYYNLGTSLNSQGKTDEAIKAYKQVLELDPDNVAAKHILSALTGQQTTSAPSVYVEELFDDYAVRFDQSLVDHLKYNVPKLIAELILEHQTDAPLGSVLDLGCGTGLAGVELKDFCQEIEGIDLSKKMLAKARQKNVYNKLNHAGIIEYLAETPLNFDLFLSTDVFVYVGELSEVFRLIKSRNRRHGRLAFSTEHTQKADFFLEKSGRYSHSKSYIESLCNKFDYQLLNFSTNDLRKNGTEFITGGLYLLEF